MRSTETVLFLLLLLCSCFFSNAQKTIENSLYTVVYSEAYQQPLSISYKYPVFRIRAIPATDFLMPALKNEEEITYENTMIKTHVFKAPGGIKTSDDEDYRYSGYDRGHLVPVKSFAGDQKKMDYLWSYLNCALMHPALNRGVWRILESYERALYYDSLENVKVDVILTFSGDGEVVDGGAAIPSHFTKIIEYGFPAIHGFNTEVVREVYMFPNDESVRGKNMSEFKLEHLSGVFTINKLDWKKLEVEPIRLKLDTLIKPTSIE